MKFLHLLFRSTSVVIGMTRFAFWDPSKPATPRACLASCFAAPPLIAQPGPGLSTTQGSRSPPFAASCPPPPQKLPRQGLGPEAAAMPPEGRARAPPRVRTLERALNTCRRGRPQRERKFERKPERRRPGGSSCTAPTGTTRAPSWTGSRGRGRGRGPSRASGRARTREPPRPKPPRRRSFLCVLNIVKGVSARESGKGEGERVLN